MLIKKSFTLIEIIVVLVIISLMAGFGIPSFSKAILNAKKVDALNNLKIIHSAATLFYARNSAYPLAGDVGAVNRMLKLNIIPNDVLYKCDGASCFACSNASCESSEVAFQVLLYAPLQEGTMCPNPMGYTWLCPVPPPIPPFYKVVDEAGNVTAH